MHGQLSPVSSVTASIPNSTEEQVESTAAAGSKARGFTLEQSQAHGSYRGWVEHRESTGPKSWCPEEDSNLHGFHHWYLKPARLPIPPSGLSAGHLMRAGCSCQRDLLTAAFDVGG
jgi:hypothetical protein